MTNPRDFIAARLDEDEAAARVATEGPWSFVGYDDSGWAVVANDEHEIVSRSGSDDATHTALHDPARVLREVAAKRAVLAAHADSNRHNPHDCIRTAYYERESFCWAIQQMAAIWSDHPDYNPEWSTT